MQLTREPFDLDLRRRFVAAMANRGESCHRRRLAQEVAQARVAVQVMLGEVERLDDLLGRLAYGELDACSLKQPSILLVFEGRTTKGLPASAARWTP